MEDVFISLCIYKDIYIYMCVCVYTYIHTYTHVDANNVKIVTFIIRLYNIILK
jgi:hypothetical protein